MLTLAMHKIITVTVFLIQSNVVDMSFKKSPVLVAPGFGADGIMLGSSADEILSLKGYPERISEFKNQKDLFEDVLRVNSQRKIFFDKIYYYETKRLIVLFRNSLVTAIIGLSHSRITDSSVNLARGAEYFLFSYGNKHLNIITKKDNTIYLYSGPGISIVDDGNDDIIDIYMVFPKKK